MDVDKAGEGPAEEASGSKRPKRHVRRGYAPSRGKLGVIVKAPRAHGWGVIKVIEVKVAERVKSVLSDLDIVWSGRRNSDLKALKGVVEEEIRQAMPTRQRPDLNVSHPTFQEDEVKMSFRSSLGAYSDSDLSIINFVSDEDGYKARKLVNREPSLTSMPRDVDGPRVLIFPKKALSVIEPLLAKDGIEIVHGKFFNTDNLSNVAMTELRATMKDA